MENLVSPLMDQMTSREESVFDVDGPPSSPFVSEVDNKSRVASTQFQAPSPVRKLDKTPETTRNMSIKGLEVQNTIGEMLEDKENIGESENYAQRTAKSPRNAVTLPPLSEISACTTPVKTDGGRPNSSDSELMPPPTSTRRTPHRPPLKSSQSAANTPRTSSRIYHHSQSAARTSQQFQAELDLRESKNIRDDTTNIDDTCVSDFSQVPEMTLFARLGQSPTRREDVTRTPYANTASTPSTSRKRISPSRSPSPTPRRQKYSTTKGNQDQDGTQTFLIDFTSQLEGISRPNASMSPSKTEPDLLQYLHSQRSPAKSSPRKSAATPSKQNSILNLLDFELPPAPTPRSVPTITVRELESLKSSYMSQISNLRATLSGKEAEVESLKKAVGDAERRAAEAQEGLREETCRREDAEQERSGWERRGQELENVLKNVREEVLNSELEKDDLVRKVEDGERRVEEAEERASKAEERFADALNVRTENCEGNTTDIEQQVQRLVAAQIDSKIEAVSRELHTVYKEKHERKVATLKRSYEARSEKRHAELTSRISSLEARNSELEVQREAAGSEAGNHTVLESGEVELRAQVEEQNAAIARLETQMQTSREYQAELEMQLKQERIEKGDLVAAVDEMLALQMEQPTPAKSSQAMGMVEDFRKSIGTRSTGLKPPGESKIGRGGHSGLPRGGGSASGKSKMLANIERMGRTIA